MIDYRGINAVTKKDKYPIPETAGLLDQLSRAQYFTSLDLRSGYWQVRLKDSDCHKTAFTTRYGLYKWRILPMGLTNAPSTFQRVMNTLFHDMLDRSVVVYLDDILIFSKSLQEHEEHVRQVLQRLQDHSFYCKLKKCSFFQTSCTFLGHKVDQDGVDIDRDKVSAVQDWPVVTNVKG